MTIEITKTITEQVEIKFPLYVRYGDWLYYRFTNEWTNPMSVQFSPNCINTRYSITINKALAEINDGDAAIITEEEFNEAYDKAVRMIAKEFFSIHGPKDEQK